MFRLSKAIFKLNIKEYIYIYIYIYIIQCHKMDEISFKSSFKLLNGIY